MVSEVARKLSSSDKRYADGQRGAFKGDPKNIEYKRDRGRGRGSEI